MKKKKRFRYIFLILGIFYVAYTLVNQQIMINRKKAEIEKQKAEHKRIEERNLLIKDQIQFAETDEFKAKAARERIGLILPGETVYIFNEK